MSQYPGPQPSNDPTQPSQYPQYAPPPPQAPKKYGRGCLIWGTIGAVILVLLIGGVIVAALSSGGKASTGSTPTTNANGTQPTATSAPSSTGLKVGQSATLDQYVVTVNKVSTSKGSQFNAPQKAGDVFLLVDVSVKNETGQAQTISSIGQFNLKDSTGQAYTETIDTDAPSAPDGNLTNGATLRGTLAYEIPGNLHTGWTFGFVPNLGSTDEADWTFSV